MGPDRPIASVGVILVDERGYILLQLRDSRGVYPGHWGTVGGAVEPGETVDAAARREVYEETGYRLTGPLFVGGTADLPAGDGTLRHSVVLVAPYDGVTPIACHEGTAITFIDPATLDSRLVYPGQKELIQTALIRYLETAA